MYEIIHVVDPETPSGLVRRNLEIEAVDGHPLATGYYFVLWPTARPGQRNPGKRYFGPFPTREEARLLHRSALALGIVQEGQGVRSIAECRSIVRPSATTPMIGPARIAPPPPLRQQAACAA